MEQITLTKKHHTNTPHTLVFTLEEYPNLSRTNTKCTQQGEILPQATQTTGKTSETTSMTAKELCDQIIQDIKNDFTKLISTKLTNLCEELKTTFSTLKTNIQEDTNNQITKS